MNKKKFINKLFKDNSIYNNPRQARNLANSLKITAGEIYSESQRFVFELIQNADDASILQENEVYFDFSPNCLIVSHNGKPFDEDDIISLTSVGDSTKKANIRATGYKGIGFKSVFGKSDRVSIFSGGYQFRFDEKYHEELPWQIIPIWTELEDLPEVTKISLDDKAYNVSTILEMEDTTSLKMDLEELLENGQVLLFLRNISKISVLDNGKFKYSIEKKTIADLAFDRVTLSKSKVEISSWLVKTFQNIPISDKTREVLEQDSKTPEKLKEARITEISFAAKIVDGKVEQLRKSESLVFTYLPTKYYGFGFPFLVNGNFLTNAGREALHEDRVWNQWLMELVAQKNIEWLKVLSRTEFKFQILELLPDKLLTPSPLQKAFNDSFEKALEAIAFIPNQLHKLKKVSELIVDRTRFCESGIVALGVVFEFINREKGENYQSDAIVHSNLSKKSKLKKLGIYFFEDKGLEAFIKSTTFQDVHKVSQNYSLIKFFFQKSAKKDGGFAGNLKNIPFIYSSKKELRTPERICFPSMAPNEHSGNLAFINQTVNSDIEKETKVGKWLKELGVTEPTDLSYLENEILPNIHDFITADNYIEVTRYIFDQHKKNSLNDSHYSKLENLRLLTKASKLTPASQCYLSNFYVPTLKLEEIFKKANYVSENYKEGLDSTREWNIFFHRIGVSQEIRLVTKRGSKKVLSSLFSIDESYFEKNNGMEYTGYQTKFRDYSEYTISKLLFIEEVDNYRFSRKIWADILNRNSPDIFEIKSKGHWGYERGQYFIDGVEIPSYNKWIICNMPIIPTTLGKCYVASKVFVNDKEILEIAKDFLPVFDYQGVLDSEWRDFLPFKKNLEVEDFLTILSKHEKKAEEYDISKISVKLIGKIYNKLAKLLPDLPSEKKEGIKDWAEKNKLLSTQSSFENSNELNWISIEGFSNATDKLKLIEIPGNSKTDTEEFIELMSLFGIQVIDEFNPSFGEEGIQKDFSLKNKLMEVLVFFAALLDRKDVQEFETVFVRLEKEINQLSVFSTSEIRLTFRHKSEMIQGSSLRVYREGSTIYYKDNWRGDRTLFDLLPELSDYLGVKELQNELNLLLKLSLKEIKEWMKEQGFDLTDIKFQRVPNPNFSNLLPIASSSTSGDSFFDDDGSSPIDEKSLASIGVGSREAYDKLIKRDRNFAAKFSHRPIPNQAAFNSAQALIKKAKKRIIAHLKSLPKHKYDLNQMDDDGATTILGGIVKDKNDQYPISIVTRPAYNNFVILHYTSEWDTLELEPTSELWVDDGDTPRLITLGHVLKTGGIEKFPI